MPTYEIEVIPGLEDIAVAELRGRRFGSPRIVGPARDGWVMVDAPITPASLNRLRSAIAVYQLERFAVPRPLALLGHEHLTRLLGAIRDVIAAHPPGAFHSFRLSAAGADSPAFARLRSELARALSLEPTHEPAQLQLAFRRAANEGAGWEVAIRTSPIPLSTRPWRVCNLPGALNATIASGMARLADPKSTDRYVNVGCGSATLLVERLELGPVRLALGIDLDPSALACARQNLQASGHSRKVSLVQGDAARLPLPPASIDTVVVDLPFGHLVGPELNVETLYDGVVREATRVVRPGGHLIAITTRGKSFGRAVEPFQAKWTNEQQLELKVPFQSGYIQPRVYALRRTIE